MWEIIAKKLTGRGRRKFPDRALKVPGADRSAAIQEARRILVAEGDGGYAITSAKQL